MSYSIVLLNYNNSKDTITTIEKVKSFHNLDYIVVVDNNSMEIQCRKLESFISKILKNKVFFLKNNQNLGYAEGNNIGLHFLNDSLNYEGTVLVMNPDVIISENNLEILVSHCEKISEGIFSPKLLNGVSWWKFTNYRDTLLKTFFHLKKQVSHYTQINSSLGRVDVLSGALLAAKMSTWSKIDFFDGNTFLYFEEEILQYRARKKGVHSYLVLDATYQHKGGTSTNFFEKKESIRSIVNHELRIQKSREYYFSEYLNITKSKIIILKVIFYVHTFLIIVKRKFKNRE